MDSRVSYHPQFFEDVTSAAAWYDERRHGLGSDFIEIVEARIGEISANPERFGIIESNLRFARVPRFPYIVVFEFTPDYLIYFGVVHTSMCFEDWLESRI